MYKNKVKEREKAKERMRKYRQKGVTNSEKGVTLATNYPDILDKLVDEKWRETLEKICYSFEHSPHPSYKHDVFLGDVDLDTACKWLEATE